MTAVVGSSRRRAIFTGEPEPTGPPWNAAQPLIGIPTPDGSGHTIHPSVVDFGTDWNGYRYWMADTPYPGQNDDLENPCIFASHDGITWVVPDGLTNPIDPWPGGPGYNSDTELVYDPENDRLVCYWRDYNGVPNETGNLVFCASHSSDGVTWTSQIDLIELTFPTSGAVFSPAVLRVAADDWRCWFIGDDEAFAVYTADNPLGPWTGPTACNFDGTPNGGVTQTWHGDVVRTSDGVFRYICSAPTYSTSARQYLASSLDGVNWSAWALPDFVSRSGQWDSRLYRATLVSYETVMRCWYGAFDDGGNPRIGHTVLPIGLWPDPPGDDITPPAASLSLETGVADVELGGLDIAPPSASLALTAPVPSVGVVLTPPAARVDLSASMEVSLSPIEIAAPAGQLALGGAIPGVLVGINITAPSAQLSLSGADSDLGFGAIDLEVAAAALSMAAQLGVVTLVSGILVDPPAATLTASAAAPEVETPGVATLNLLIELELSGIGTSYPPGSMQNPIPLSGVPFMVDFSIAPPSVNTPDPQLGDPADPDLWYVWDSSASNSATFTYTGSTDVSVEVWVLAEGATGALSEDEMSLLAYAFEDGEIHFNGGSGVTYLIRIHALTSSPSNGTLAWSTVARSGTGILALEVPTYAVAREGWLEIRVLNAVAGSHLTMEIDGTVIPFSMDADESGMVMAASILLAGVETGVHVLRVTDAVTSDWVEADFTVVEQIASIAPVVPGPDVLPDHDPAPVPRWKFFRSGAVDALIHNPSTMTSPHMDRIYTMDHTADPAGQPIVFEGRAAPVDWTVEGTAQTVADRELWEEYLDSNSRFYVIDHLQRAWVVTLESVDWSEIRNTGNVEVLGYKAKFLIYDGPFQIEEAP